MAAKGSSVKTERIERATKRQFSNAKRSGKPITWQQARRLAVLWCAKMWPGDFASHPLIDYRNGLTVMRAG